MAPLRIFGTVVVAKGEKFIPLVKIHVPRGIRPKEANYFVNLQKRIYKVRTIKVLSGEESDERKGMKTWHVVWYTIDYNCIASHHPHFTRVYLMY